MQVGDIVKFNSSGYCGIVVGFTKFDGVTIFLTGKDISFRNPITMAINNLHKHAEVVSSAETNS